MQFITLVYILSDYEKNFKNSVKLTSITFTFVREREGKEKIGPNSALTPSPPPWVWTHVFFVIYLLGINSFPLKSREAYNVFESKYLRLLKSMMQLFLSHKSTYPGASCNSAVVQCLLPPCVLCNNIEAWGATASPDKAMSSSPTISLVPSFHSSRSIASCSSIPTNHHVTQLGHHPGQHVLVHQHVHQVLGPGPGCLDDLKVGRVVHRNLQQIDAPRHLGLQADN